MITPILDTAPEVIPADADPPRRCQCRDWTSGPDGQRAHGEQCAAVATWDVLLSCSVSDHWAHCCDRHLRAIDSTATCEQRGNCPACGKHRTRSTTLANTVNPLNKNPETGLSRTEREVAAVLAARAEAWTPDFTCRDCAS